MKSPKGKLWRERQMLKVPFVRTLIIQTCVARFCRTMGTLQQGGLPIIDSLRISREVMGNVVLEKKSKELRERLLKEAP